MTLEVHRAAAISAAHHAKNEIAAFHGALRHGLHLTATQCAARAHAHAAKMRLHNRRAHAAAIAREDSALRRAFNG
jgi:hypothetical protein